MFDHGPDVPARRVGYMFRSLHADKAVPRSRVISTEAFRQASLRPNPRQARSPPLPICYGNARRKVSKSRAAALDAVAADPVSRF